MDPEQIERYRELLGRLAEPGDNPLTDAELVELGELSVEYGESLADTDTDDAVAEIVAAADAAGAVRAEQGVREQAGADRAAARDAALARLNGDDADTPADGDTPADADTPADGGADETPAEPVAASGRPGAQHAANNARPAVARPAGRRPPGGQLAQRNRPETPSPTQVRPAALVAAAQHPTLAQGAVIDDMGVLARSVFDAYRSGIGPGRTNIARTVRDFPEDRILSGDAEGNSRRLGAVLDAPAGLLGPRALVAAGGLCAPAQVEYEVPVIGDTGRPVRDFLTDFHADRGAVKWRDPISPAQLDDSAGVWTMGMDAANAASREAGDDPVVPVKVCATVDCPDEETHELRAVWSCVEFRNVTARFDPEGTAATIRAAQIVWARRAENLLLADIEAFCNVVLWSKKLGAVRDFLAMLDHLRSYSEQIDRVAEGVRFRVLAPRWLRRQMVLDVTRMTHTSNFDSLRIADAILTRWLDDAGASCGWYWDGLSAAAAPGGGFTPPAAPPNFNPAGNQFYTPLSGAAFLPGGAGLPIPKFPDKAAVYVYYEGDVLMGDGGTLDLGLVRDSALNASNAYLMFHESWEAAWHRGAHPAYKVAFQGEAIGSSSAPIDLTAFDD